MLKDSKYKISLFTLTFMSSIVICLGQTAFKNFGNIQMHNNAEIGFHTNFINDGVFDTNNLGYTGFYSDNEVRTVSGTNKAVFYNVEIDAINNLQLNTSLGVTNELEFVNGKVITPRNNTNISLDFINYNVYIGEDDNNHTDGYASITGEDEFVFPIGDDDRFRPMITPFQSQNTFFKGAYFFEDPNTPTIFSTNFTTSEKQLFIENISNYEFWDLDGNTETVVTLTWDTQSNIPAITQNTNLLRVVGWSETQNEWVDLGRTDIEGNLNEGRITSNTFIPDDYIVITIGSEFNNGDVSNDNFIISPNSDNLNDALVFEGLELFKENKLLIFNRWGEIVFEINNYKNDWEGVSTAKTTILSKNKLPVGTYFYILKFGDINLTKEKRGWIYINR
ncbi:gliding motility-associated-like protein [Tenacibaculum adriaticum]|uniref:Gliding motility-associated-like protein n=1 Tax=Tenacibaculum adriaticum TaxID=413713 RepID=A0A5S5DM28_9FLAO|nr:gliding motility-associated C-terminal domain-containing protein [Tenacibaculum adriaticum]TYP96990.1 gliding motility-associated-like protein [Tenacibaculum adriaticum]